MMRNGSPSSETSSSSTESAPGCSIVFAAYPSRTKRSRTSLTLASSGRSILMATRFWLRCVAE